MKPDLADRPLHWLIEYGRRHPGAWRRFEEMRADRSRGLPTWPAWCFAPLAAGMAIASRGTASERFASWPLAERVRVGREAAILTALAAWRMTKGVYVFDPDLLQALWLTPVTGSIPSDLLERLPEWCVYVPLDRDGLRGVWAHLESDANDGHAELRLVTIAGGTLEPLAIHLGGSVAEGVESMLAAGAALAGVPVHNRELEVEARRARAVAEPIVSLLLWLCSERPEIEGRGRPGNPKPKRVKGALREFAAPGPRTWAVGARVGAALRAARGAAERAEGEATGRRVRPHVRRAHWHTYWTGPRSGEQTPVLRWLHPILVAGGDVDELPAVVRAVKR
ncbi:MAG TPA: hypothetical protein VF158_07985 [Longimicrobiales bacterium]